MCKAFVGVAGFEPATSASQTRRDNRATLHPEKVKIGSVVYAEHVSVLNPDSVIGRQK